MTSEMVLSSYKDIVYGELTAERLQALENLSQGTVPANAVKEHLGKGGKKFKYADHVWVTGQLRAAFGQMWNFHVANPMVFPDDSVVIMCTLTVTFLVGGSQFQSSITEVGAWKDETGKMPVAMRIASAASRGLVRCTFRRFGIGSEFYGGDNPETSPGQAYSYISAMGTRNGMAAEEINNILRGIGINKDNIVERYIEAYAAVFKEAYSKRGADVAEL